MQSFFIRKNYLRLKKLYDKIELWVINNYFVIGGIKMEEALQIIGGFLLMTIGVTFAGPFLKWTNCPDSLLPQATLYFRIYFCGMPSIMLYNFCASILRSTGDTKRPMYFLILKVNGTTT